MTNAQKVEMYNQEPGHLTGYDCPDCLNRGFYYVLRDGNISTKDCRCKQIRKSLLQLKRSGLADMVTRYNFATWSADEPWQLNALNIATKFANTKKGWIIASGAPGTGKTHICTAICNELLKDGLSTNYLLWRDISVKAKGMVNEAGYQELMWPYKHVNVLYIDDLFKAGKDPTPGDVNLAFEILNARYNDERKITIISTEKSMGELMDIDEALGSRIYERTKGNRLNFAGKTNWRLK